MFKAAIRPAVSCGNRTLNRDCLVLVKEYERERELYFTKINGLMLIVVEGITRAVKYLDKFYLEYESDEDITQSIPVSDDSLDSILT